MVKSSSSPLRILLVSGTPNASSELRIDAEVASLRHAIGRAPNIAIEILQHPTIMGLNSTLEAAGWGHFDVLHFVGHGRCHRDSDSGTLSFAGEHNPVHAVHQDRLMGVFGGHGVDLVVLHACESAGTRNANPFAAIATKLLSVIPSVLAMPLMSSGESVSIAFADALYAALADDIPIQDAANLAQARVAAEYETTDSPIRLMVGPKPRREQTDVTTVQPIPPVRVDHDAGQLNLQPQFDERIFARAVTSTSLRSSDSGAQAGVAVGLVRPSGNPITVSGSGNQNARNTKSTVAANAQGAAFALTAKPVGFAVRAAALLRTITAALIFVVIAHLIEMTTIRQSVDRWAQTFGGRLRRNGSHGFRCARSMTLWARTELLILFAKFAARIVARTRAFAEADLPAAKRASLSFAQTSLRSKQMWVTLMTLSGLATAIAWPWQTARQPVNPSTPVEESQSAAWSIQPKPVVTTYLSRGQAHYLQADYEWAIDDFTDALRLQPDCVFAYNGRGLAYENRGFTYEDKDGYDRAIADYTRALQLEPGYAVGYRNRGIAYDERGRAFADEGDSDRAIADYTRAVSLASDFVEAYTKRGLAYENAGKSGRAIADFDRVIRLEPDNSDAYDNRAHAYRSKGDDKDAIADYTHALTLKPDDENAYSNRGDAYEHRGYRKRAVADYRRAVLLKPDDLEASIRLDRIVPPR